MLLGALTACVGAARAQAPEPPGSDVRRDLRSGRDVERERERAQDRAPFEGPPVTYSDVLRDPDNVDLNYAFAQAQVRAGDLRGAASTLERILLVNPEFAQVRLLYAIVLYRLDSVQDSEREFRTLEAMVLPDDVRREVERYRREIERKRQRTRYVATVTTGGQYDSNRDAAPSGGLRLFADLPVNSESGKADTALVAITSLRLNHDLGTPEGHEFFAVAIGYKNWQRSQTQFDLGAAGLESGFIFRGDEVDIIPSALAGTAYLVNSRLLNFYGGRLRVERQQSDSLFLYGDGLWQYQNYSDVNTTANGVAAAPTASLLTGTRFDAEFGATYTIDTAMNLTAAYVGTRKSASVGFDAYDGNTALLRHSWLLGGGQFLVSQASYEIDQYDGPDPFVSASTRRDRIFRARLTYGAPLATLSPWQLPDAVGNITLLAIGEYTSADSNISNYTYDNWRGQLLLARTWEF